MSYLALARKWRPRTFTEVVGQEHVTRALCNAIRLNRLHHAYLFSGTRGVGKTTLARILVASLNCESGVVVEPCGKCRTCAEIRSGRFVDLIEVDAASRTGVDDMRNLLETVQYVPTVGRCKVYLVDEVHMLSKSSFNALLKTLEEPPAHAKFLFATTAPEKIPPTVLSRCLQLNLIRISHERIADYLANRLTDEGITYENGVLLELAVAADGSMRDALSLLDHAIASGGGELSMEVVENALGITARVRLPKIVRALVDDNPRAVFSEIEEMHRCAVDFSAVLDDLLSLFHELAVHQVLPEAAPSYRFPPKEIVALSRSVSAESIQLYYQIATKSRQDMLFLSGQRSVFEMALLRMLCFRALFAEETASGEKQPLPLSAHSGSETVPSGQNSSRTDTATMQENVRSVRVSPPEKESRKQETLEQAADNVAGKTVRSMTDYEKQEHWKKFPDEMGLVKGGVRELCSNSTLRVENEKKVMLLVSEENRGLASERIFGQLRAVFRQAYGRDLQVDWELSKAIRATPLQQKQLARERGRQKTQNDFMAHPLVKTICQDFDAEVETSSIRPRKAVRAGQLETS